MEAKIQEVHTEDDPMSPLKTVILLWPTSDTFFAVWQTLEKAGFVLRNWENKEIIVYANKEIKNG